MKITHDLHVHTHLSLCAHPTATAELYIENARKLGIKLLGITDHMWDDEHLPLDIEGDEYSARTIDWSRGYKKQNYTYTLASREEFAAVPHDDVKVIFGCECEYDYLRHAPAVSREVAEKLDFIIVPNSHTHLTMPEKFYEPYERHVDFMLDAFMDIVTCPLAKYITAVAHPFEAVCCPYDKYILIDMITDAQYKKCFEKAKENGIAVEINVCKFEGLSETEIKNNPTMRMYRIAKDIGCKFTFGTDAHSKEEQLDWFPKADIAAKILGLSVNNLADIAKLG